MAPRDHQRQAQRSLHFGEFCALTGSGLNFDATSDDGRQVEYGVSGFLLNSNLVLFDLEDDTLFTQMAFTGLNGSRKGDQLQSLPVIETTWALWKKMYPNTTVPRSGTGLDRFSVGMQESFGRESTYMQNPYEVYNADHDDVPFPPPRGFDYRLLNKDIVMGICRNDKSKVYPLDRMPDRAVINDQLYDLFYVVLYDSTSRTAITYSREFEDEILYFYAVPSRSDLPIEFVDDYTGSRWNMRGEAVDGPATGARLEQVKTTNAMWFAWSGFFARALIWDGEGIIEVPSTAVDESNQAQPHEFALSQTYPNPFNATTRVQYEVPHAGPVRLSIYNALGQHVRTLVEDAAHAPGRFVADWHGRDAGGRDVGSGEHFYELRALDSGLVRTMGMVLVR